MRNFLLSERVSVSPWLCLSRCLNFSHVEKNLENVLTNGRQTMRKINERFRHLVSLSGKRRKTTKTGTDEKETTGRWVQFGCPPRLSPSLLSSFCCCLSFLFYLTKTPSGESACFFFSSFFVHWGVHFPSFFSSRVQLTICYSPFLLFFFFFFFSLSVLQNLSPSLDWSVCFSRLLFLDLLFVSLFLWLSVYLVIYQL